MNTWNPPFSPNDMIKWNRDWAENLEKMIQWHKEVAKWNQSMATLYEAQLTMMRLFVK